MENINLDGTGGVEIDRHLINQGIRHGKEGKCGRDEASLVSCVWMGLGLAGLFAGAASKYPCDILARCNNGSADCKQILELLELHVRPGAQVDLIATGSQSEEAISMLSGLLKGCY